MMLGHKGEESAPTQGIPKHNTPRLNLHRVQCWEGSNSKEKSTAATTTVTAVAKETEINNTNSNNSDKQQQKTSARA